MRMSSKNQVTIPVAVCEQARLQPGDELEPVVTKEGVLLRKRRKPLRPKDLIGIAAIRRRPRWTDADLEAAIAEGAAWDRKE
jgi:bifunctional DNA-binding transcriptional regulator/antitoxin component of YhaV-PrlF toxin-antitoxin module